MHYDMMSSFTFSSVKAVLPAPFNEDAAWKPMPKKSKYNRSSSSNLNYVILTALLRYAQLSCEGTIGGAICVDTNGYYVSEYVCSHEYTPVELTGETLLLQYNPETGVFTGGKVQNKGEKVYDRIALDGKKSEENKTLLSAMVFTLLPFAAQTSDELQNTLATFVEMYKTERLLGLSSSGLAQYYEAAHICSDNLYYRLKRNTNDGTLPEDEGGILNDIPKDGKITPLWQTISGKMVTEIPQLMATLLGTPLSFAEEVESATVATPVSATDELRGKYAFSTRTLTEREQAMIPELESYYCVPKEVRTIARHIKDTTGTEVPFRNILLRGPAGTGKTEAVKAIACALSLPYTFVTFSANTEIYDLLGQILPDTDSAADTLTEFMQAAPSAMDMEMDPVATYTAITGKTLPTASSKDCMNALVAEVQRRMPKGEQRFRYVDTPLVNAIRYGYVCELQEPSVVANPAVLVGLNGLFDRTQSVVLPTGEVVKRHPDTVIIMTTNTSYEGCRPMNQSVISRMNMIAEFALPGEAEQIKRISRASGLTDKRLLKKMVAVAASIIKVCHEQAITDGSIGQRELISWALSTKVTGNAYEAALMTIIPLATADVEMQTMLISDCLETQFSARQ